MTHLRCFGTWGQSISAYEVPTIPASLLPVIWRYHLSQCTGFWGQSVDGLMAFFYLCMAVVSFITERQLD